MFFHVIAFIVLKIGPWSLLTLLWENVFPLEGSHKAGVLKCKDLELIETLEVILNSYLNPHHFPGNS